MKKIADLLKASSYTTVMTGAGMSTESGLPDFRSQQGLWQKYDPVKMASTDAMHNNRASFVSFYQKRIEALQNVFPNDGHLLLSEWERTGLVQQIITQNVDNFHQKAGSRSVSELHGSLASLRCNDCGAREDTLHYVRAETNCPSCGGMLRPNIVLFGEMLPAQAIEEAEKAALQSDLFIVLGTSLTVAPASYFPADAKQSGASLVIINESETELDHLADHLFTGHTISETIRSIHSCL